MPHWTQHGIKENKSGDHVWLLDKWAGELNSGRGESKQWSEYIWQIQFMPDWFLFDINDICSAMIQISIIDRGRRGQSAVCTRVWCGEG